MTLLCSGDMLLEALVACAGVTLRAVCTSLEVHVEAAPSRPRVIGTSALFLRRTQAIEQAGDLGLDPCQRLLRLGVGGGEQACFDQHGQQEVGRDRDVVAG